MKVKPKSCSCYMCRHSPVRRAIHRQADRSNRRAVRVALSMRNYARAESLLPYSTYTD